MNPENNEHMRSRLARLEELEAAGVPGFPNDFVPGQRAAELHATFGPCTDEELAASTATVSLAGRIMTLRIMGKAAFLHLRDRTGTLQVHVQRDRLGDAAYGHFKRFEVGDHVGVRGRMMRTRTGELTVSAAEVRLLAKALRPLPEKFHGLQDVEARYRQRYVDLVMNEHVREIFRIRAGVVGFIRRFLDDRGFLEVETPMMHPVPGGAAARPFVTHHNALDIDLYLRIAPELYLKRLLVGGLERVYEINRNFRNEGLSPRHNPEFTMLEFYQAYATFGDLMDLTEALITGLAQELLGTLTVPFGEGGGLDLSPPWPRVDLRAAVRQATGLSDEACADPLALRAWLRARDPVAEVPAGWGAGKLLAEVYDLAV
ncbi:MAG: lysine--tRNA ligase, partial [Deltaproteobacteria bacterium]|nr:lysine--tRNA ligase [Deltaproteobacteria bacterium]